MILFYEKATGKIVGTIDGRVHQEEHLKMWVGDKDKTGRIVIQWKPTGKETITIREVPVYEEFVDEEGFTETRQSGVKKYKDRSVDYEPDHPQKKLFMDIENGGLNVYKYKINLKTKELELK